MNCLQKTECVTAAVGCIVDAKLCIGGGVGTLVNGLVGDLDLQLATLTLPIAAGGAAGAVVNSTTGAAGGVLGGATGAAGGVVGSVTGALGGRK